MTVKGYVFSSDCWIWFLCNISSAEINEELDFIPDK